MFYDTHAHYDDEAFDEDRDILLPQLHQQGISLINDIGCDIPSSQKAISIAQQYPFVYAVVGAWPGNTGDMTEEDLETYGKLAQHPKVVAIGEVPESTITTTMCPETSSSTGLTVKWRWLTGWKAGRHPRNGSPRRWHGDRPKMGRQRSRGISLLLRQCRNGTGAGAAGLVCELYRRCDL